MQWSKIKKRFESQLADSLKGRLEVHAARYRNTNDGRCWLVLDQYEIVSVEAPGFTMKIGNCQFTIFRSHMTWELGRAIGILLNLSIEEALACENPLIQGLALLDRRVKKSYLIKQQNQYLDPFAQIILAIRKFAEGLTLDAPTCPKCGTILVGVPKM